MVTSIALALVLGPVAKPILITRQPTKPVRMHLRQTLEFLVSGTPGTGASWTATQKGAPGLKFLGMHVVPSHISAPHHPPAVGGSQQYSFLFTARAKGHYAVELTYGRSWELKKGKPAWKTLKAHVIIE